MMSTRFSLATAAIAMAFGTALATEYTWQGGASGDWNLDANWGGSGHPQAGDTAVFNANATITTDFSLGGSDATDMLDLQIADGVTLTINASISGTGGVARKGDGTLMLKKANPFTGDFKAYPTAAHAKGRTYVYDGGALGTSSADFDVNNTGFAALYMDAGGGLMTFDIPIVFSRCGASGGSNSGLNFSNGRFIFNKSATGRNRLTVKVSSVTEIRFKEKLSNNGWCDMTGFPSTCHIYFEKGLSLPGGTWLHSNSAAVYHFLSDDNVFHFGGNAGYGPADITIMCETADVFKKCTSQKNLFWHNQNGAQKPTTKIDLGGYDQHYASGLNRGSVMQTKDFGYRSTDPAQVIIDGTCDADLAFNGNFWGKAGLTWSPSGTARDFILSNVVSTTKGTMKALNGAIRLADGSSFEELAGIEIGATGAFVLEEDAGQNTFAQALTIADGGVLAVPAGCRVSCYTCAYKGAPLANGIYTADTAGAEFLTGGGELEVNSAEICEWVGAAGGNWSEPSNWSGGAVPAAGKRVRLIGGASVRLDTVTAQLQELAIPDGTLTFTEGWETIKIAADRVVVGSKGVITTPGAFTTAEDQPASRVWIECGDLTIEAGGKIDVNGKGWRGGTNGEAGLCGITTAGFGPGAALQASFGSSHGGIGAVYDFGEGYNSGSGLNRGRFGYPYDDPYAPVLPGSGGANYVGSNGGGAVRIAATGTVTVNGSILASAISGASDVSRGSGGSVWIQCATFAGSGSVLAEGGSALYGFFPGYISYYLEGSGSYAGGARAGGGGMIRIENNAIGSLSGMRISAAPGYFLGNNVGFGKLTAVNCDKYRVDADLGTLTFNNNLILDELLGKGLSGRLVGVTNYTYATSLDWTWGHVRFAGEGANVTIQGDLTISGENSRMEVGGIETRIANPRLLVPNRYGGKVQNVCTVAGNMTIAGGAFDIRSADTGTWGGELNVGYDLTVGEGGYLYPWSDPVTLVSPRITVGGDFYVYEGGTVMADGHGGAARGESGGAGTSQRGWLGNDNATYGAGRGDRGSAHGGSGGPAWKWIETHDEEGAASGSRCNSLVSDEWTADHAGAGGGSSGYDRGGLGGGLVYVQAKGIVCNQGRITANGCSSGSSAGSATYGLYCMFGAGAGGAVYLEGSRFSNEGTIMAEGGSGLSSTVNGTGDYADQTIHYTSGCGGGGRVVIKTGADVAGRTQELKDQSADYHSDSTVQELVYNTGTISAAGGRNAWNAAGKSTPAPQHESSWGGDGTVRYLRLMAVPGAMIIVR